MLVKLMTGLAGTAVVAGAILFSEGAVTIDVKEKRERGHHYFVVAPAALVPWAGSGRGHR